MAVLHSLSQCAVCGRLLDGEAADVDGELWCHPCADKRDEPTAADLCDQLSDVRQALFERTRLMDAMQDERDELRDLLKDMLEELQKLAGALLLRRQSESARPGGV